MFLAILFAAGHLAARPLPVSSARSLALGGTGVAENEDPSSLFINPAGMALFAAPQMAVSYGRLDMGGRYVVSDLQAALAAPTNAYGMPLVAAGGFQARSVSPGVHVVDLFGGFAADVPTHGLIPWPLEGGAALKIRSQSGHEKDDNVGKAKASLGIDAGVQSALSKKLTLGAVLRDLFPPGVQPTGPQLRFGAHYQIVPDWLLLADIEIRRRVTALHAGAEKFFYRDLLKLRIGNAFQSGKINQVAFGAGFNFSPTQVDVAFVIPMETPNDPPGQFRVSMVYRFGAPKFTEIYFDRALQKAGILDDKVKDLEEKQKALLSSIEDLEQAKRLSEEELSQTAVKRAEKLKALEQETVKQETRADAAAKRAQSLEEKAQEAEERIRRAGRPAVVRAAPAAPRGPRTHTVQAGDTLRALARKYYGDEERWKTIYDANPDKIDRGRPKIGAVLRIPD